MFKVMGGGAGVSFMFKVMGVRGVSYVQGVWVRGVSHVQGDDKGGEGRQPCSR